MLVIKASHIRWRKSVVALTPNLRTAATVTATLQAVTTLQATAAPVLTLCQTIVSAVMITTMWRTLTWTWMKEMYLHLVKPISIRYWRWQGPNTRQKERST
eukprot:10960931-Ditylum_brightwellii.AAC.1